MNEQNTVRGYKIFGPDWTCRGFQYQVGECYEMDEMPVVCKKGFHFYEKLIDCYDYYSFDENNKVAEIIAYGDIDIDENEKKICTNNIKSVKELEWQEVLNMVNIGNNNTGCHNRGDYNSGDYNATNYSSGCFNTEATKIFIFNKLSDWTCNDWKNSNAKFILDNTLVSPVDPIIEAAMTKEEKKEHPEYQTTGFYSKRLSWGEISDKNQKEWDKLSESSKKEVMAIPNFDKKIFKKITGIDVDKGV